MRRAKNEIAIYVKTDYVDKIKNEFEKYNIHYSGRLGISSRFYKILLTEKIESVLNDNKEFKRICEIIINETGIGQI